MRKTSSALLIILFFQVITTTTLAVSAAYGLGRDKAPQGLRIMGLDLGGLNQEQVWTKINNELPEAVTFGDKVYPLSLDQTQREWKLWLSRQYSPQQGSWLANALNYVSGPDQKSSPPPGLDKAEITGQLEKLKPQIDLSPRPAGLSYQNGRLLRKSGAPGRELDIEGTWQELNNLPADKKVPLKVKPLLPAPSDSDLLKTKDVLGDYTTFFDPHETDRTTNVRLAAKALNGYLIAPGTVFSFNTTVGERTESLGYLPAYIFEDRQVVKGDGGGVCQDSSTLYQAAKQANLKITERHAHTLPVAYVGKNQDATVAFGELDFKFRNDTQNYLLISAQTGDNWLRVRLIGEADAGHPALKQPGGYPVPPGELENALK